MRFWRSLDAFPRKGHRRRPRAPRGARKLLGKSQETPRKVIRTKICLDIFLVILPPSTTPPIKYTKSTIYTHFKK